MELCRRLSDKTTHLEYKLLYGNLSSLGSFKVDQKHLESFEMWCWRRMQNISWTDHVREEDVLIRVNEQRNILHEINKRKANWIGHILLRNCILQRVIEGKIKGGIEVIGRRERKCRKLLDDLKERRGYCHLKEEDLDRFMRRARVGRGFGPDVLTYLLTYLLYAAESFLRS
jgi:hypothetical protein